MYLQHQCPDKLFRWFKWHCSRHHYCKRLCQIHHHEIGGDYGDRNGALDGISYSLTATGSTSSGVTWTTACPSNADLFPAGFCSSAKQRNMAYQAIANGEIYQISPQYWQQNQQQQALLLRYFALPLKEDEHHLWLAVDSLIILQLVNLCFFKR